MKIRTIHSENRLCTCCMEEHNVKTVIVHEETVFKNCQVEYEARYFYCDKAEEFYADEQQMKDNDIRLKDAYRLKNNMLTSYEISDIRNKYGITQTDLCLLLGWGGKTITRYESHQVQDKAHDYILKKLDKDPEWFLSLLCSVKDELPSAAYQKYYDRGVQLYEEDRDTYLRKTIEASYVKYRNDKLHNGNSELSLDKVIDIIRYLASSKEEKDLYKVKLVKQIWYADMLSYKKRGHSITGLVYQALAMGAVPVGHNFIIELKGVPCEEEYIGDNIAYHFVLEEKSSFPSLDKEEIIILEQVVKRLGAMSTKEIVSFMHNEKAFIKTEQKDLIQFSYADELQI